MAGNINREPMLDMYIFETTQLIDQLEQKILDCERLNEVEPFINEIFRVMHTIKGSSAMMLFNNIASLAHSIEDLFYYLREEKPQGVNYSRIFDIVLEGIDFIKRQVVRLENGEEADGDSSNIIEKITEQLNSVKFMNSHPDENMEDKKKHKAEPKLQKFYISSDKSSGAIPKDRFEARVFFEDGCGMENIRAFSVVHDLKELVEDIAYYPDNIIDSDEGIETIKTEGFKLTFNWERSEQELEDFFSGVVLLKDFQLKRIEDVGEVKEKVQDKIIKHITSGQEEQENLLSQKEAANEKEYNSTAASRQSLISVSIPKLDKLMDLVGELVISEAMVTQNPELEGLNLNGFYKASRQLKKVISELQDTVMSMRLVPLSVTFHKMNRLIRDLSKKLEKEVQLEIIGEETEVDKNIIEHISDPLMHLIRNSMDHGMEKADERKAKGKPGVGKITLEARSEGGDVWILVKDDGKGLDRNKILEKAYKNGLVNKSENELTDKEIYSYIFLPGFSTKDSVTEYSGRGVGMDVVVKNIQKLGGSVSIDSIPGKGTTTTIKIPLTLAIIDGITVNVGTSRYTIPTVAIRESFKVRKEQVITDPDGNEMIMVRGEGYPVVRLHRIFNKKTQVTEIQDGIITMIENDSKSICLFTDALLGGQQVVVKALPSYIRGVKGIAGCTLLGDGGISLILDVAAIIEN